MSALAEFIMDNVHGSMLIGLAIEYLLRDDLINVMTVSRLINQRLQYLCAASPAARSTEETERIVSFFRHNTPKQCWTKSVDIEIRQQLSMVPYATESEITQCMMHRWTGVFLAPQTNIGTLDTSRVIERLTQATLSRFHSTGSVLVQDSGNLENLLNPMITRGNGSILIFFDKNSIDVHNYWDVKNCICGKFKHIKLSSILKNTARPAVHINLKVRDLPDVTQQKLRVYNLSQICALHWELDVEMMVASRIGPCAIEKAIADGPAIPGIVVSCHIDEVREKVSLYLFTPCMPPRPANQNELPDFTSIVSQSQSHVVWYSVVEIFCAGSSTLYADLRTPEITPQQEEKLQTLVYTELQAVDTASPKQLMGRNRLCVDHALKKGNRRWSCTKAQSCKDQENIHWVIVPYVKWIRNAIYRLEVLTAKRSVELQNWMEICDMVCMEKYTGEYPVQIKWLVVMLLLSIRNVSAKTTRQDNIRVMYTAILWHIAWSEMAEVFLSHYLRLSMLSTTIAGIPGVEDATILKDRQEWCLQLQGSATLDFIVLSAYSKAIPLDVVRCTTSNHPEICRLLGIEAIVTLFQSGTMAQALGVCQASCNLIVDKISNRGYWMGVNRTTITASGGAIDNTTIEDPTKHIRNAAFSGCSDSMRSTSSSLLVGNVPRFGTGCGISVLLSLK